MSLAAGGYRLRSANLNKQLPTTHAAILIAPAHLPLPSVESHWTMEPPVWASRVCPHKHMTVHPKPFKP
jgi:hypothetical protein